MTNYRFAIENPADPGAEALRNQFTLGDAAQHRIEMGRALLAQVIENPRADNFIAIIGPCAMSDDFEAIMAEGRRIAELQLAHDGLYTVHRAPLWKPRSDPVTAWNGLETTNPKQAMRILVGCANNDANMGIEMGRDEHAERYKDCTTFAWIGSRAVGNTDLLDAIVTTEPDLPVGIKNGMSGAIDEALHEVERINARGSAPAILIFRGGEDLRTPEAWEKAYLEAYRLTNGRLIIDLAHGSEMAHDPTMGFKKSVAGQISAMQHLIKLAEQGHAPLGVMMEASDVIAKAVEQRVDPPMPLQFALDGAVRLHQARKSVLSTSA